MEEISENKLVIGKIYRDVLPPDEQVKLEFIGKYHNSLYFKPTDKQNKYEPDIEGLVGFYIRFLGIDEKGENWFYYITDNFKFGK